MNNREPSCQNGVLVTNLFSLCASYTTLSACSCATPAHSTNPWPWIHAFRNAAWPGGRQHVCCLHGPPGLSSVAISISGRHAAPNLALLHLSLQWKWPLRSTAVQAMEASPGQAPPPMHGHLPSPHRPAIRVLIPGPSRCATASAALPALSGARSLKLPCVTTATFH